jgi:hypothetical protein
VLRARAVSKKSVIFKYVLVLCGAILILGGKYAKHYVGLQGMGWGERGGVEGCGVGGRGWTGVCGGGGVEGGGGGGGWGEGGGGCRCGGGGIHRARSLDLSTITWTCDNISVSNNVLYIAQ